MAVTRYELTEYEPLRLERGALSEEAGEILWKRFGTHVDVAFPSPRTDWDWELTSVGWVGHIPLTADVALDLRPRVPLSNLFRMWEYAYRLKSAEFLAGLMDCASLDDFYEQLAGLLAGWTLDRTRKGLHREYVGMKDRLPYVRGRLDSRRLATASWDPHPHCRYQLRTADIDDNRILSWTLDRVLRSGLIGARTAPRVRSAYRALRSVAPPTPIAAAGCVGRQYHRLNADYRRMHALARFFLEQTGPSHEVGDRTMVPFLVNMPRLFELFVAEWLHAHAPPDIRVDSQEVIDLDPQRSIQFRIDLVMREASTGLPTTVIDTKYKIGPPATSDVEQVVAYATAQGCTEAVLIYPGFVEASRELHVGPVRVRELSFDIGRDLDAAGFSLLDRLLQPALV